MSTSGKHLGNTIENKIDGMQKDISIKRARYINRQNNLSQEFYFAHPITKFTVNQIYNTDFTGSPLWDFNSECFESLCKTWNVSIRIMFDLPRTAHRYLIEPITEKPHIQFTIMKRFLKFCEQLRVSNKSVLKSMIMHCQDNTMTRTGNNLRTIMLLTNDYSVLQIKPINLYSLTYKDIPEGEEWRVNILKELIDARYDRSMLQDFSYDEINHLIELVSTT